MLAIQTKHTLANHCYHCQNQGKDKGVSPWWWKPNKPWSPEGAAAAVGPDRLPALRAYLGELGTWLQGLTPLAINYRPCGADQGIG